MKTFRRCRRQWYLSQIRGLRRKGTDFGRPTGIGTRVHEALAAYYNPQPRDPLEVLAAGIERDVEAHPAEEITIRKAGDLCEAMISGYVEWLEEEGEDMDLEVVASEDALEVPLMDGVTLLSKIDSRVRRKSDGARLALEHKTVGDLSTPVAALQLDTQLLTEHLVEFLKLREEGREDEVADGVLYNMLRKVKRTARANPPFFRREPVRHNIHELRNHWTHVMGIAHDMLEAEQQLAAGWDHHHVCPPNPIKDCKWDCEFFQVCVLFDDGSDPEPALEDLYETGDPLERYKRDVCWDDAAAAREVESG